MYTNEEQNIDRSNLFAENNHKKRIVIIIASLVIAVAIVAIGIVSYMDYILPQNQFVRAIKDHRVS